MKKTFRLLAAFLVVSIGVGAGVAFAAEVGAGDAASAASGAVASEQKFPSLEPFFVFDDGSKTPSQELTAEEMITVGIRFSIGEVDKVEENLLLEKYSQVAKLVKTPEMMKLDQKKRAEKILAIMYQKILKYYETDQTRIDVALREGSYNCVSASVIYAALAKEAGLTVKGQMAPEHCFCSVYVDGKKIDVETTNPAGFEPGTKKLSQDSRYYVVPQQRYSGRKETTDRVLVSLVAKNLASLYNEEDDFDKAIPVAVTRREFLASDITGIDDSVADFETLCSNYVVVLNNQGRFEDALEWVRLVHRKYDYNDKLQQVFENAVYNCIAVNCEKDDIEAALKVYDGNKALLREGAKSNLEEILLLSRAQYETDRLSNAEAIEYLRKLKKNSKAQNFRSQSQIDSWLEYYWLQMVQEKFDRGLYLEGAKQAQKGLEDLPKNKNLQAAYSQGLYNYDVTVHNQFARYANAGNYAEARSTVKEGLKNHPDSTVLKDDLKLLDSMN